MKNSFECAMQDDVSLAVNAKDALERVGSGKALDSLPQYYSQGFVDHVNGMKFQGLEGARRSVGLYAKVLERYRTAFFCSDTHEDFIES